jgi:hypothetical protein
VDSDEMTGFVTIPAISLYAVSVFGWGALFLKLLGPKFDEARFYTAANGTALLIFSGGLLNDFGLTFRSRSYLASKP